MAGIVRDDMYDYWHGGGYLDDGDSVPSLWAHDVSITLDDKVSLTKTTVQALSSDLKIPDTKSLLFGDDIGLTRGAANRLDLADGDSFNLVSGALMIAGTPAISSGRAGDLVSLTLNDGGITNAGSIAGATSIAGQSILLTHTGNVATFNQTGSGNIIVGQDGGTPVFVVSEPGKLTTFGGFGAIDVNFAGGTTYKVKADGDATLKDVTAELVIVNTSPTIASHATRKDYVDDQNKYDLVGSGNAEWIPLIFEFSNFNGYDALYVLDGVVHNIGAEDFQFSMRLPLSCNKGGLTLRIARLKFNIVNGDANNNVMYSILKGNDCVGNGAHELWTSGAVEWTTCQTIDPTDINCGSYDSVSIYVSCKATTTDNLLIAGVFAECYYA